MCVLNCCKTKPLSAFNFTSSSGSSYHHPGNIYLLVKSIDLSIYLMQIRAQLYSNGSLFILILYFENLQFSESRSDSVSEDPVIDSVNSCQQFLLITLLMTILSLEALSEQCERFMWVFEQPLLAVTSALKRESFAKTF